MQNNTNLESEPVPIDAMSPSYLQLAYYQVPQVERQWLMI